MKPRRKILFVGMQDSIHIARWIDLIADAGWQIEFFPVHAMPPNEKLRGVTLYWPKEQNLETIRAGWLRQLVSRLKRMPASALRRTRRLMESYTRRLESAGFGEIQSAPKVDSTQIRIRKFRPTLAELGGEEAVLSGRIRLGESECCAPVAQGPGVLASVIHRIKPDLIHSMEFQHAGYLVLRAKELYGEGFAPWLATNWGSDIFYFRRFPEHRAQIERLLQNIDHYSCECKRDIDMARDLGYRGPVAPVLPNSGGFDLETLKRLRSPDPPSRRRLLMVKGYHHFVGRAMISMKVLDNFFDQLKDYEVVLYSVSAEPRHAALALKARGMNIRVINAAPHEEILECFGRSRLYMGISISDAISTSVLEAMAMGAFPIQTNTSCCNEWFEDGVGGFIVPPDDFQLICDRFQRVLSDDDLVNRAAAINWETVKARLDKNILRPRVHDFYDTVFTDLKLT